MPSALFLFVSFAMLGMEARDLHMLGKYHTTKQYLPLCFCCLFILSICMFVLSVSVCLSSICVCLVYLCLSVCVSLCKR